MATLGRGSEENPLCPSSALEFLTRRPSYLGEQCPSSFHVPAIQGASLPALTTQPRPLRRGFSTTPRRRPTASLSTHTAYTCCLPEVGERRSFRHPHQQCQRLFKWPFPTLSFVYWGLGDRLRGRGSGPLTTVPPFSPQECWHWRCWVAGHTNDHPNNFSRSLPTLMMSNGCQGWLTKLGNTSSPQDHCPPSPALPSYPRCSSWLCMSWRLLSPGYVLRLWGGG